MNEKKNINFTNLLTIDKIFISSLTLTEYAANVPGIEMNVFQRESGVIARISFNLSPVVKGTIRLRHLKTKKLATASHFWKSLG